MWTAHYYSSDPGTIAGMLVYPDPALAADLTQWITHADYPYPRPFRIAECNNFGNGGVANVSDSFASALWGIDFMFQCAHAGVAGINFHGGPNNYTPIYVTSFGEILGVEPLYYAMYMVSKFINGACTLMNVTVSGGTSNFTAYASESGGDIRIIVNNKDATTSCLFSVSLPSSPILTIANYWVLTSSSLSALTGQTFGGATIALNGAVSPVASSVSIVAQQFEVTVPAGSAVLIQASP